MTVCTFILRGKATDRWFKYIEEVRLFKEHAPFRGNVDNQHSLCLEIGEVVDFAAGKISFQRVKSCFRHG